MLSGRTRPASLRTQILRSTRICKRCFNARIRLLSEQSQSDVPEAPKDSPEDPPLSPIEAFRRRYVQATPQPEVSKERKSPSDLFNSNWTSPAIDEDQAAKSAPKLMTLDHLAAAYRTQGASKKYDGQEEKQADGVSVEASPKRAEDKLDLSHLIEQDEVESVDELDIFEGENMRDYQGVLPLEGSEYIQEKFSIKLGSLVETRGFINLVSS